MSGLGLLLTMVAVTTVVVVAALAAPFRPSPRRPPHGAPLPGAESRTEHGFLPPEPVAARPGRLAPPEPGGARPAVVPAGRSPPPSALTPLVRHAAAGAAGVTAGFAFGPPGLAVVLLLVAAGPRWRRQREERLRLAALEAELPEVVDLLALAVGAGLTVAQAVGAVASRGRGPLSAELAAAAGDVARGRRLADALDELPDRAGEPARPLAATLAACERYGAPVADALDRLAGEARDRQRRRAEQAARRLPVLLLFPLVLCTLPAFALLAIVPLIADAVPALRL